MAANQTIEFDNWCRNKAGESVKSNHCWTIEKFLDRKQNKRIVSHKFEISGPDDKNTSWSLYLNTDFVAKPPTATRINMLKTEAPTNSPKPTSSGLE